MKALAHNRSLEMVLSVMVLMLGACTRTPPVVFSPTPAGDTSAALRGDSATPPTADSTHVSSRTAAGIVAQPRFYRGLQYGSEAEFNPFSIIVNEGYDELRTSDDRRLTTFPYRGAAIVVLHSPIRSGCCATTGIGAGW